MKSFTLTLFAPKVNSNTRQILNLYNNLTTPLDFLKEAFTKGTSLSKIKSENFPTDFIPLPLKPYLYAEEILPDEKISNKKKINVHQYEFLVYDQLEQQLSSGKIFVNNSEPIAKLFFRVGSKTRLSSTIPIF